MKLICDDNLGKLAKYLRILGIDTFFEEDIDDNELLRIADAEGRFLLTRDHNLLSRSHPYGALVLEYDDPLTQLLNVIVSKSLVIEAENLFRRCSLCNTLCIQVDKSQISNEVWPYILKTQDVIKQCPSCGRYYWKGTHYKKLLQKLINIIPIENIKGTPPSI